MGTFILYAPSYFHNFVQYDDDRYVFDNAEVLKGLSLHGLMWALAGAHVFNYHPVTWLSHMLDCQLFGAQPGPAHLVSSLIHSLNAGLLFLFLRSATGASWRSAIVAALFAWHPLRVESVAWISERKDLLSGFFFILTLWSYATYVKASPEEAGRRKLFYRLSLAFFVLGLLSKPMLVTAPFVLFLIDWWPLKRGGVALWPLCREKIPFFLLSALMGVTTIFAQSGAMNTGVPMGWSNRINASFAACLWYLEKLFWPQNLSVLNLRPAFFPAGLIIVAAAVVLGLSAAAVIFYKRYPYIIAGWLWFLVMLLPVIGVIPVGLQLTADRYTYLPCIGLSFGLVWGIFEAASRLNMFWRKSMGAFAVLALLACAAASEHQLAYWRNTETLMNHALQINPKNFVAHLNLGVYYTRNGDAKAARFQHDRARELLPK